MSELVVKNKTDLQELVADTGVGMTFVISIFVSIHYVRVLYRSCSVILNEL